MRNGLQSAPIEWQRRFVECLNELKDMFGNVPKEGTYEIHLRDNNTGKYIHDVFQNYERGRRIIPMKDGK